MLLRTYNKEIFRPECNPSFQSVHCLAHLGEDIREALPYLNTTLGGTHYSADPPSLTLRAHGKLITLHARMIAINALEDETEAERVIRWLQKEINEAWEHRDRIQPSYANVPKPGILEILKRLPKTNCRQCGQPTCMVFATLVADGAKDPEDCPAMPEPEGEGLEEYLRPFCLGS